MLDKKTLNWEDPRQTCLGLEQTPDQAKLQYFILFSHVGSPCFWFMEINEEKSGLVNLLLLLVQIHGIKRSGYTCLQIYIFEPFKVLFNVV